MGEASVPAVTSGLIFGSGSDKPASNTPPPWTTDTSNIFRNSLPPAYKSSVPADATKMPTDIGQFLFPGSYTKVANPGNAALAKGWTNKQPASGMYKSYMDYASRLLNPDLYRIK